MLYIYAFLLLVFTIIIHEFGHALIMNKYGIRLKEFGIGFRMPNSKYFLRFKLKSFPGTDFTINPILLGAFVQPDKQGEEAFKNMGYRRKAHICGAGPLFNFIFAFILALILLAIKQKFNLAGACILASLIFFCLAGGFTSRYIFPILGLLSFSLLVYLVVKLDYASIAGPIGIIKEVKTISSLEDFIFFGLNINIGVALFNLLPLVPLDGGHIFGAMLKKINTGWEIKFQKISILIFLGLVVLIFISDFIKLLV
jgi:membrane-associated protease RseP (regulator of RpoE activity)